SESESRVRRRAAVCQFRDAAVDPCEGSPAARRRERVRFRRYEFPRGARGVHGRLPAPRGSFLTLAERAVVVVGVGARRGDGRAAAAGGGSTGRGPPGAPRPCLYSRGGVRIPL